MTGDIVNKDATDLVCIQLEVHIWSGRRHLDKSDLVHANPEFGKLPEKDLANLGSVKICDPEEIKTFQKIKNQAELLLKRAGLPILGATGIPASKYPDVFLKLQELQDEYTAKSAAFVAAFDRNICDWKLKHLFQNPEWEQLFRDLPTADHVGGRLSFQFHPYRISAPAAESHPDLNDRFEKQMGGLKGELLQEVATEAGTFINSLSKKTDGGICTKRDFVTPKTLGPLRRAAEKLDAFAFIDPTIGPLATLLSDMLDDLPDLGRVDGQKLLMLGGIARLLNDPVGISELAAIAHNGGTAQDAVSSNVGIRLSQWVPAIDEVKTMRQSESSNTFQIQSHVTDADELAVQTMDLTVRSDEDAFLSNLL